MPTRTIGRTNIILFMVLTVQMFVLLAGLPSNASAAYKPAFLNPMYDGYIYNGTFTDLYMDVRVTVNESIYITDVTTREGFSDDLISLFDESLMINTTLASLLPKYDQGICHSSWKMEKAVQRSVDNLTLVYSVKTGMMLLMNGRAIVNGNESVIFLIMIGDAELLYNLESFSDTLIIYLIVGIIAFGFVFAYVYFFKEKIHLKKQERKIIKSGKKRENVEKKRASKRQNVKEKQPVKNE